ncbi:mechanosensitive ion channel family protein [Mesorhizobium xinjiangense]|uniref:mechanosensitive ion channel family protein n=1 Tax=Mesorhizobium xinjiangense TaxID=2678685 RepID=UPI001F2DD2FB|nr:mechanosensitive ion channel family protein [Mesorhizobium xinjiangense]
MPNMRLQPFFTLLFVVLCFVAALDRSFAQAIGVDPAQIYEEQKPVVESYVREANELARRVELNSDNDALLVQYRGQLETLAGQVLESAVAFRPRLQEINTRLEQLGSPPGDGMPPEPEAISDERVQLSNEKAQINALIGEAESLSLRVNRMIEQINELRRDLFAATLWRRYDISAAVSPQVVDDLSKEVESLYRRSSSWLRFVVNFRLQSLLWATFFSLAAAGVIFVGGRRLFGHLISRDVSAESPSYLSRLSVAFWSTLLPTFALSVFFGLTYGLYKHFNILREDMGQLLAGFFQVTLIVFFVSRLAWAALSPRLETWRLAPIDTSTATKLYWLACLTAVTTGLDYFLNVVNEVLGSPLSLTVVKSLVATVIVGVLLILIGLVRPRQTVEAGEGEESPRFTLLNYIFLGLGVITIISAVLGYLGLARFLSQQIVVTGAIIATMYIGFQSAGALSAEDTFVNTSLGRYLQRTFRLEDTTLDQLSVVASILIYILIGVIGLPLIILQWGFQWADISGWAYRFFSGITIGSMTFSLIGILTGIFVFVVGYFLTRGFQGWLDGSVMARGKVDPGVRNSIKTAVGYAGIALAAIVGISAAGIDLSSLALVAGALSLGVGFGLQNIVSNFVSGLILLAERPFQAGDWIEAGAVTGTVKRINVRATEIETFQRQTVILPNSELINAAVGNWTHRNKLGRIEIKIGVAYGSDVRKVHDILMELAQNHPLVLKNPEPFVFFADFGASSLDFELRFYLSDVLNGLSVQTDIRFAIVDAFAREGIEIPFPQQDIHIRSDTTKSALQPIDAVETEIGTKRRRRPDPDGTA